MRSANDDSLASERRFAVLCRPVGHALTGVLFIFEPQVGRVCIASANAKERYHGHTH